MKNFLYIFLISILGLNVQNRTTHAQSVPVPGEILITEFMSNPSAVSDTKGEWFELLNTSDKSLLLNGLTISDLGSNKHTINSDIDVTLEPGAFFILARNEDPNENGGVTPDYIYSNFSLGNSEDEIILTSPQDTVLDIVAYNSEWLLYSGASLELNVDVTDFNSNDWFGNWHLGIDPYGSGDLGTPGKTNSITNGISTQEKKTHFVAFPNPCHSELFVRLSTFSSSPVKIELINILGQTTPILDMEIENEMDFSIDLTPFPVGIYWLELTMGHERECLKIFKL